MSRTRALPMTIALSLVAVFAMPAASSAASAAPTSDDQGGTCAGHLG